LVVAQDGIQNVRGVRCRNEHLVRCEAFNARSH